MSTAAFFSDRPEEIERVYGGGRREAIAREVECFPEIVSTERFDYLSPQLSDLEVIFATWGMPQLTPAQVAALPALKVVFYAAGSVQYFARPFLARGVQVVSAWAANAVPVAQLTLAQIILAAKGYFAAERLCRTPAGRASEGIGQGLSRRYPGLFGVTVAILGAGMIGTRVIELLHDITQQPEDIHILVYDPFLSAGRAASLDVEVVTLEEAFARGQVISNHIADLPETRGLLTRALFARMPAYASFINTGRGATLDEAGMLAVMAERPDLTALLDVTYPEPPDPSSPIYALENVLLSPHIAGSSGSEVLRGADAVIAEWQRYRRGEPLRHAVSLEMLKTMA